MTTAHPYPTELLLAFASLPRREKITVAHVAACGRCKLEVPLPRADGTETGPPPLPHSWPLLDVLRELPASRFAQERRPARSRLRELLKSPPDRWREQVQEQETLHSPMFAWLLLSGSYELSFEDPLVAEELARLALVIADFLPAALDATATRVESQGWVLVGHALALRKARAGAEAAFAEAIRRRPDRDPLEEALYCRFLAGLRRIEKRVPEALALLGRAIVLFQEAECAGQEIAARNDFGVLLLALGERGGAFDALLRAFLIAEDWMSLDVALRCRGKMARCALDLDRLDIALTLVGDRAADERRASRGVRADVALARSAVQARSGDPQLVPGPPQRTAIGHGDEVLAALAWISALVEEYAHGRGAETVRPGGRV